MAPRRSTVCLALVVAASPLLASCSSKTSAAPGAAGAASGVAVTSTDTTCDLGSSTVAAGSTTFKVTNKGSKTTEVYVYGANGAAFTKVVGEVENIGPGTSRELTATLTDAAYEVACKPGQTGDGIRAKLTVTGGSAGSASAGASTGASTGAEANAKYDREVELSTDGKTLTGLSGLRGRAGEKIEFKLQNKTEVTRILELKDPTGAVAGESEPIKPGATGELIVALNRAGTWDVNVEGEGLPDVTGKLTVG